MSVSGYMLPAGSYKALCRDLSKSFKTNPDWLDRVRMVGIVFARPDTPFVKSEMLPSLTYYHHRSGQHINFYWAGFDPEREASPEPSTDILNSRVYHDKVFETSRKEIELRSLDGNIVEEPTFSS